MNELIEFQKDKIWLKEYPIKYAGTRFNSRMSVVRLKSGNLFIHSPCNIDDDLKDEINALGKVECIVAPGYYHYFHVPSAQRAFPESVTYICPGLETKLPDLKFEKILSDQPDVRWAEDFEQVLVRGNKYIWEVAFFHKETATLILVDLIENFTDNTQDVNWVLKLWWKLIFHMWENPKPAPEYQFGWRDKDAARASMKKILHWDFNKIIISHGDLIEENAKEIALKAWRRPLEK
jgi:hypothetical protein